MCMHFPPFQLKDSNITCTILQFVFFFNKTKAYVYLGHIFYCEQKHLLIPFFIDAKNPTVESVMIDLTSPIFLHI